MGRCLKRWLLASLLLAALGVPAAGQDGLEPIDPAKLDHDPLRRFVPSADLFTPVPAGRLALKMEAADDDSFEDKRASRHGGMVMGYCLKSSCSYITHIVVEQVCANQIGGAANGQRLVLGVMKLAYGLSGGYLKSLQGRNFAENFARYGAHEVPLAEQSDVKLNVVARGMGPVAPLVFDGDRPAAVQDRATLTFQQDMIDGTHVFEVRHLCQAPLS